MVPQTETNNADMYPPLPVGVGTKSKADPAIAPEAIATASGVAVPPPGRQNLKRRAMDAMARDAATEMPKIPPQHLVVGSRVEGLFNEDTWFPGTIEAIRHGKHGSKQIFVLYDDGSHESYYSNKAADMNDLRYDQAKDEPEIHQWNICHHLLCDTRFRWRPCQPCPLTGRPYKALKQFQRLLQMVSSGTCASDPLNLAKVKTFLIETALEHLAHCDVQGGVTSSEWAQYALSMLGESLEKHSKPLEYEPEGAVKYSREDTVQDSSPAHEQTGASGGSASDLRPEGDIFKFDMLRPRKKLTNETWSQQPYLKFTGNLGEHGPFHGSVHETRATGSCWYVSSGISTYFRTRDKTEQGLIAEFGEIFGKRISLIREEGNRMANTATKKNGEGVRKLLASYLVEERQKFLPVLAKKGLPVDFKECMQTKSRHKGEDSVDQWSRHILEPGTYACETVYEIFLEFVPPFTICLLNSSAQFPAVLFHSTKMDMSSDNFTGNRIIIALHLITEDTVDGNDNHYEVIVFDKDVASEVLASELSEGVPSAIENGPTATADVAERVLPRPAVDGCSAVKNVVKRSTTQSSLDGFVLRSVRSGPCQKCAKPGQFCCTSKNGSVFCNVALCSPCMGMDLTVSCPRNYLCELHRNGEAAAVKFGGNFCFECGPSAWWRPCSRDLYVCDGCSKKLCEFHAVRTRSQYAKTAFDGAGGLCRQCSRNGEEFERVRMQAARAMLGRIGGEQDPSKWSQWSVETVKAAIIRKNAPASRKAVVNEAHRFCTFVYALICGGLCGLAQQLIECVVLINLALESLSLGMAVHPFEFVYMQSPDPSKKADGMMLAKVTQAFAQDIVDKEKVRRGTEGEPVFPAFDFVKYELPSAGEGRKIRGALYAFDLLDSSPTCDLLWGTIQFLLNCPEWDFLVVTKSQLTEADAKTGKACPYGQAYKPAAELAEACSDRILYLWSDWGDDKIVKALLEKKLDVLILANGFNFGHIHHALAYAQVALVMIEWLSFAGLLLSRALVHWTITSRGLVAEQQLMMPGREAALYVDCPYPPQTWYRQRLLGRAPPAFKHPTGLIYLGRPDRITFFGGEFFDSLLDALQRVPAEHKLFVQGVPFNKMREIVDYAKKYSEENYSVDLSPRIEAWPFYLQKEEYHDFLLNRPELFAVSGDPLGPHTGCVDGIGSSTFTVVWTTQNSQWPALVPREINKMLGLEILNTETRDEFTNTVTMFLLDRERSEAVVKHIYHQAQAQVGPFDNDRFGKTLVAVTPRLLQAAKEAGEDRSRIPDIDTSEFYKPTVCTKLEFPEPIAMDIGENSGMVLNRAKNLLVSVGCPFKGLEGALTAVLQTMEPLMTFDTAHRGGSRVTLVGKWKPPATDGDRVVWRNLDWFEGKRCALKLEYEAINDKTLHNSQNIREALLLNAIEKYMLRSKRFRWSFTRLLSLLAGKDQRERASVGYAGSKERFLVFSIMEAIPVDLGHAQLLKEVRYLYRSEGVLDERARALGRSILHFASIMHQKCIYLGDVSFGNIFPVSWREILPNVSPSTRNKFAEPGGIGWCDWGSAVRTKESGSEPVPLARQCTRPEESAKSQKSLTYLKVNRDGIGLIGKQKLMECADRRRSLGYGQTTFGTPGMRDTRMVEEEFKKASKTAPRTLGQIMRFESYGHGAALFQIFCPRSQCVPIEKYEKEQNFAASSAANMLATMKKYVEPGVVIKQPETLALWSNLVWNLMKEEDRISEDKALLHPALSLRILSQQHYEAVRTGDGILFSERLGPVGSPMEDLRFPAWKVKLTKSKGLGAFSVGRIENDAPAALYAGLLYSLTEGEDLNVWPPGRHNVRLFDGQVDNGQVIGELPMEVIVEESAPGVIFNAGDSSERSNLKLDRYKVWTDPNTGITYMPFFVSKREGINPGEEGLWEYKPFDGRGGSACYSFNDSVYGLGL